MQGWSGSLFPYFDPLSRLKPDMQAAWQDPKLRDEMVKQLDDDDSVATTQFDVFFDLSHASISCGRGRRGRPAVRAATLCRRSRSGLYRRACWVVGRSGRAIRIGEMSDPVPIQEQLLNLSYSVSYNKRSAKGRRIGSNR